MDANLMHIRSGSTFGYTLKAIFILSNIYHTLVICTCVFFTVFGVCINEVQIQYCRGHDTTVLFCSKNAFHRIYIIYMYMYTGDRGGTVVKVLCYKSLGRWFVPSWCPWIFH
jgi:hypothetical protein